MIASIHQPSSEVFELFDQLYLLSGGKTVFFGQASEAYEVRSNISFYFAFDFAENGGLIYIGLFLQFFAQAGFPCPALRNPSDHFLRCINSDFDKVKATLKGSMKLRVRPLNLPSSIYFELYFQVFTPNENYYQIK